jgi:thiamine monophosphate synthase
VATTGVTGIAVISALMTAAVPAETAQRLAAVVKKREGNVR